MVKRTACWGADMAALQQVDKTTKLVDDRCNVCLVGAEDKATIPNSCFTVFWKNHSTLRRLKIYEISKQRCEEKFKRDSENS